MPRQILLNDEARREILSGIAQVAEVVGATLGPRGQTVILSRQIGSALITKDGVTVARSISLADPWQNEGAKLVQEVAGRTDTSAGDGTTGGQGDATTDGKQIVISYARPLGDFRGEVRLARISFR